MTIMFFVILDFIFTGLLLSNFCTDYATQIIHCGVFGFTSGAYIGTSPVILIRLVGAKKFTKRLGVQLLFMGVGIVIGPPITG